MPKPQVPTASNDQETAASKRDHHGDRSVPPPLDFDVWGLPDSTLLTERDVAAAGRWAVATVAKWRLDPDHPLKWIALPGGFRRTSLGDLRKFLAMGQPRKRPETLPRAAPSAPPPPASPRQLKQRRPSRPRPRRRADRAEAAELQERT
jgi:hypothetical protein